MIFTSLQYTRHGPNLNLNSGQLFILSFSLSEAAFSAALSLCNSSMTACDLSENEELLELKDLTDFDIITVINY